MTLFSVVLFLHISVVLFAISLAAILHVSEWQASRASTVAELRVLTRPNKYGILFAPAVVLLLLLGLWLVHLKKSEFSVGDGWAWTAIVALVILFAGGPAVMAKHAKALDTLVAATPDGPVTAELRALVMHRPAWVAGNGMTGLALGVVFNMTNKPDAAGAIAVLVIATAIGVAVGLVGSRTRAAVTA